MRLARAEGLLLQNCGPHDCNIYKTLTVQNGLRARLVKACISIRNNLRRPALTLPAAAHPDSLPPCQDIFPARLLSHRPTTSPPITIIVFPQTGWAAERS